jgi:hypothetical protein
MYKKTPVLKPGFEDLGVRFRFSRVKYLSLQLIRLPDNQFDVSKKDKMNIANNHHFITVSKWAITV